MPVPMPMPMPMPKPNIVPNRGLPTLCETAASQHCAEPRHPSQQYSSRRHARMARRAGTGSGPESVEAVLMVGFPPEEVEDVRANADALFGAGEPLGRWRTMGGVLKGHTERGGSRPCDFGATFEGRCPPSLATAAVNYGRRWSPPSLTTTAVNHHRLQPSPP
eukprot:357604-Chlamydomonas_euryale.AAC.2